MTRPIRYNRQKNYEKVRILGDWSQHDWLWTTGRTACSTTYISKYNWRKCRIIDDYLEDDNDVEEDVLADLTFDSHALAEVVIDNPEEVVENQIILEHMDIGDAIFDIFL